ncbi:restriction endonuclease subunit S [Paenibacillus psychroresistens]|uniref:Restriction endonuclease subunit S n=2 Tax=Paenibacillus psychroresistens TaxID=1778678 RepID=A0A6B8RYL8_9BACL|nr:restriction endonuclease subunit S [Paenibacillus psychroresistens]
MQFNISLMLEAKSLEAEKAKNWLCNQISHNNFSGHGDQLLQMLTIHQQMIEVIDGITKMEHGLGKNLKIVLETHENGENGGFMGGHGGHFGMGGFT